MFAKIFNISLKSLGPCMVCLQLGTPLSMGKVWVWLVWVWVWGAADIFRFNLPFGTPPSLCSVPRACRGAAASRPVKYEVILNLRTAAAHLTPRTPHQENILKVGSSAAQILNITNTRYIAF